MRPGSPRRLLGICLLGGVFLVVFVRHLFLGDLFLLFLCCYISPSGCFCCLFLCWVFVGAPFFFCCYICGVITVGFGSWFLVVLWLFLLFLVLGKLGFLISFVVISGLLFVFICFEYTELLPGWLTSEALLTRC